MLTKLEFLFFYLRENEGEICELSMKPGRFSLISTHFVMTNKFAHLMVVPSEYLVDFRFWVLHEMQSPWCHA